MIRFSPLFVRWRAVGLAVGGALLLLGAGLWLGPKWRRENPLVATPRLALEGLAAKSLYYNGQARSWLLAQRADLLTAEDRDDRSVRVREFAQTVLDPRLFRRLDRRERFDTLLFVGDPSQSRPLLEHLSETKDFALAYVDHTSLVFRRDAAAWSPAALEPVRARLAGASARDRARCLAQTGGKLLAVRHEAEGKALLDEAAALDAGLAETWSGLANYHLYRHEWKEALAAADRALALDKQHLGGLAVKTQILYGSKRFDEAYELSKKLRARLPQDPNVLFRHAQIAHEAHAYRTEIATLKDLIALADAAQRPTTGYWLYLAQACTAAGQAQPAIDAWSRVLADPELPPDQRTFAQENLDRVKSRSGL